MADLVNVVVNFMKVQSVLLHVCRFYGLFSCSYSKAGAKWHLYNSGDCKYRIITESESL